MTSLAELRAIEDERIASERAALMAAEAARREAALVEEQRRRDDEAARIAAEREAAIALEEARAHAEREARLRVEAAEAAERARLAAALEEQRLAQEMELRRAEVARKRPTWMVALTVGAIVVTVAMAAFAISSQRDTDAAVAERRVAERGKADAKAEAAKAIEELAGVQARIAALDTKVTSALDDLEKARTEAERRQAQARLEQLRRDKAEEQRRIEEIRRKKWEKDRKGPFIIDEKCKTNAVC